MEYEWDSQKAIENIRKHDVEFADAVIVLEDENALTIEGIDHNEKRFKTLGMDALLNILLVVHVERGENNIRIISARKADKKEIKQYYNLHSAPKKKRLVFSKKANRIKINPKITPTFKPKNSHKKI